MRRALIVIATLLVIVVAVIFAALALIPDSVYRDEIVKAANETTGRELTIAGGIGISIYPVLGVKAEDVTLANANGFNAPYFARMKALDAGVKLWPLFAGKVEIARFALVEPDIALEVDAKGDNNWTFETAEKPRAEPEEKVAEGEGTEISELSLGTMTLVDGHVSYANQQSGENWEASDINLAVSLRNLDEPLNVSGDAKWKGEAVSLAFKADKPRALFDGGASAISLDVKSSLLKLAFAGEAVAGDELALSGPLDLSTSNLRKLASWLSEPMAPGNTLGAFALKGALALKGDVTRIDNAELSLDGMKAKGKLAVNSKPARPFVEAALAFDRLDLDPYLGGSAPAPSKSAGGGGSGGGSAAPSGDWSSERMDFSGLKSADADLNLSAGKASFSGMTFSDAALNVRLRNGVLNADLPSLKLYGGTGSAKIVLDASASTPSLRSNLTLNGIAIEPFMRDTSDFDRIDGTGAMTVSLTSRGGSERAIMDSLNGRGSLKLADGVMRGVDLNTMMRDISNTFSNGTLNLSQGIYAGRAIGPSQKTEFSEFGGTFVVQNGVLANNDLLLINPELRVSGAGTTNIVNRTVDYRLVSKFLETTEGQEGAQQVSASVPVQVRGSWDNLKFQPDAKALVGGALKGVTEALGAGQDPLKGALQGIFGRPGAKPKEEPAATDTSGASESPAASQETTSQDGSWASGGTEADESAAPEESADSAEEPPPTREEQIRNIFQGILKGE